MLVTSDWIQDLELPDAIANAVCPGVWPGVAIEVMPGRDFLAPVVLRHLDSMPAYVFFTLAK